MSEETNGAFEWLDRFFQYHASDGYSEYNSPNEILSEDEATDWIFMMEETDWKALNIAWWNRSTEWKIYCCDTLGSGPIEGQFLLKKALYDSDPLVRTQAAIGLSRLARWKEVIELEPEDLQQMKQTYDLGFDDQVREIKEFLELLKNKNSF